MSAHIDHFQGLITSRFRELVLATAYLEIGQQATKQSPPTASVSLNLADGITTEPMFLRELQPHGASVILGVAELFQTKAIAAWTDLLNALFESFVGMHMTGKRHIPEFKKRSTRLDFASAEDVLTQVRHGLVADFAFAKYADRIQTMGRVLAANAEVSRELLIVRKHVSIRNAIQHHASRVHDDMLRELGANSLEVLDHAGKTATLQRSESIALHVPELDLLKSALFLITNDWKAQLAAHPNGSSS